MGEAEPVEGGGVMCLKTWVRATPRSALNAGPRSWTAPSLLGTSA